MVIEISVAVIALAFAILVIYIIWVLKSLRKLLRRLNHTLKSTHSQIDKMGEEAKKIAEQAYQISTDVQQKMETLNPLFKSAQNMGEILERQLATLKEVCSKNVYSSSDTTESEPIIHSFFSKRTVIREEGKCSTARKLNQVADILELAGLGIRLWQNLKERK